MSTFTVTKVKPAGEKPNPHGGTLYKFYVALTDEAGKVHGDPDDNTGIYWQRKSDELHEGQEVFGRIEDGEYGPRFKTEQRDGPPPQSRSQGFSKDDYWRAKDERDIESQARMGRAHAQEMALRWLSHSPKALGGLDGLPPVIDWFHQDVQRFPLDADLGGGSPDVGFDVHKAAADVSAEASTAQKGKLTKLFHDAGLNREAMKAVVLWRCGAEKATKTGASQLITDLNEGATHNQLLAEIWDAKRAGDPLATRAAALIPAQTPADTDGLDQPVEPNGEKDIPF